MRASLKRIKVPQIFQMEAVECGAASLAMVLAYFNKWLPLEHVRQQCGVSRDGSDAFKMTVAAEHYGLKVKALQREPGELAQLPMPQILYWEFNHFVVLTGVSGDKYYINDPAVGERELSADEFSQAFTGLSLCFAKADDFHPEGKAPNIWASIVSRVKGLESSYGLLLLLNLLLTVPGLAMAGLAKIFLDDYVLGGQHNWLWPLLLAMLIGGILSFVLAFIQQDILLRIQTRLAVTESAIYAWRILKMPFLFFSQRSSGELVQRIRLNNQVANSLAGPVAELGLNLLNIVVYLALMALYDWVVATVSLVFVVMALGLYSRFNDTVKKRHQHWQILQGQAYSTAVHGLDQFTNYRAQGAENLLMQRWIDSEAAALSAQQHSAKIDTFLQALPMLLQGILMTVILCISAERAMAGDVSFGTLISLQLLAGLLVQPLTQLLQLNGEVQRTAGALLRLDDLRNYPSDADSVSNADSDIVNTEQNLPSCFQGRVSVKNLNYAYQLGEPIIRDLSFSLRPGLITGVVGTSGCGKSTLAKLLAGLLPAQSGGISFDGKALQDWPLPLRKNLIAYVEQSGRLMQGSVVENISLWQSDTELQEVMDAAKEAGIHEAIIDKPGAYQTVVSARSCPFSGGEIQRMTLARALVQKPAILVLDEATSALDNISEAQILSALKKRGITVVLITHRPSSIAFCDDLLVLKNGQMSANGDRRTLLRESQELQYLLQVNAS